MCPLGFSLSDLGFWQVEQWPTPRNFVGSPTGHADGDLNPKIITLHGDILKSWHPFGGLPVLADSMTSILSRSRPCACFDCLKSADFVGWNDGSWQTIDPLLHRCDRDKHDIYSTYTDNYCICRHFLARYIFILCIDVSLYIYKITCKSNISNISNVLCLKRQLPFTLRCSKWCRLKSLWPGEWGGAAGECVECWSTWPAFVATLWLCQNSYWKWP